MSHIRSLNINNMMWRTLSCAMNVLDTPTERPERLGDLLYFENTRTLAFVITINFVDAFPIRESKRS